MQSSYYNEIIKIDADHYFLFNTISCAMTIVDPAAISWLNAREYDPGSKLYQFMLKLGYITSKPPAKELDTIKKRFKQLKPELLKRRSHALIITYACNLKCTYCFEQNQTNPVHHQPSLTREKVDQIFAQILDQDRANKSARAPLSLYGGEPLMQENMDLIRYILQKGRDLGYTFMIYTNGYDLLSFVDLFKAYPETMFHISLDGSQEKHDRHRKTRDGQPSFERIVAGIDALCQLQFKVKLRCNIDPHESESLQQFKSFIEQRGWHKNPQLSFSLSEIARCSNSHSKPMPAPALDQADTGQKKETTPGSWCNFLTRATSFENCILKPVRQGRPPLQFPRFWFCPSHTRTRLYDPRGLIYTCFCAVQNPGLVFGRYWPRLKLDQKKFALWAGRDIFSFKKCAACKYILICGGGCAYYSRNKKGDFMLPVCWDYRGFLEDYIRKNWNQENRSTNLLTLVSEKNQPGR